MEALAIIPHLLEFALGIIAVYCCVTLFRRQRSFGWLLLGTIFLEPFILTSIRAIHGHHPLLAYKTMSAGSDGLMHLTCRVDFLFLYIIAVIGLFMLIRSAQENVRG